jgi:bifunctional non-homologous end joining protein LigD
MVGYTEPHGEHIGFGALLIGFCGTGKLVYAGKVGTGYDRARLLRLSKQLYPLETNLSPFCRLRTAAPRRASDKISDEPVGEK